MSLKAIIKYVSHKDEVEAKLEGFINRAVDKSTKVMERNIKAFTPVRHGHLRRSITSKMTGFGQGEVFTNPVVSTSRGGKQAHTEVNYAVYVEYGTRYMAPRAMFRKGVEASLAAIEQIFKREARETKDNLTKE